MQIAIDGPGGAGKSTIAKALAHRLGYFYVDTGAMYRCCALRARQTGIDPRNPAAVREMMAKIDLTVRSGENGPQLCLDGKPVGEEIRAPEISKLASDISALPECRSRLTELQREIAARTDVVMDGRDIGTVVLPEADLKIFLTASDRERALRRYNELTSKGVPADYETVLRELRSRDAQDSSRAVAPLRQAEDAILVDSDALNAQEVLERVWSLWKERLEKIR